MWRTVEQGVVSGGERQPQDAEGALEFCSGRRAPIKETISSPRESAQAVAI
jgi:hypothetical protein